MNSIKLYEKLFLNEHNQITDKVIYILEACSRVFNLISEEVLEVFLSSKGFYDKYLVVVTANNIYITELKNNSNFNNKIEILLLDKIKVIDYDRPSCFSGILLLDDLKLNVGADVCDFLAWDIQKIKNQLLN